MARPRVHDETLRQRLLEVASELVSTHGAPTFGLRELARRAGTSTTAVYALFGSRAELLVAVGDEAFRRFGERLAAVPRTADPRADLLGLGLAYRASALADPHFYRVMFEVAGVGAHDGGPVTERATFRVLRDAVARVQATQPLPDVPPAPSVDGTDGATDRPADGAAHEVADRVATAVAGTLWAHVHGWVSLEISGLLPWPPHDREHAFARSLDALGTATFAVGRRDAADAGRGVDGVGGPWDAGTVPPHG